MLDLEARHMPLARAVLFFRSMMRRPGILFAVLVCSSVAFAEPADTTGPDFVGAAPPRHIDRSLVASPDGASRIDPHGVVTFQLDRAELRDAAYTQIDTAAQWLKRNPKHLLVLEGHTDALGDAAYNDDLAMRRLLAVRDRLLQSGVPAGRIMLLRFGEREAMDLENPLHGADRRVVMYATQLSPDAVAAMVRLDRPRR